MCGLLTYGFHFPRHPRKIMLVRHLQQQVFGTGITIDVANPISY